VLDIVFGTLWYRLLATRQALDSDFVDDLLATLVQAPPPRTTMLAPSDPTEAL
jgi:hypothetical protein